MADIKKIVANAAVNAELENKKLSDETIKMIEDCLKTKNGSFLFQLYLKSKNNGVIEDKIVEESINSKYCYDNGVLINKYGIRNLELLHIVEGDAVAYSQSQIISGDVSYKFEFNMESYLELHKKLFSKVYDFAGELRDEFIYKSCMPYLNRKTPFCMPDYIYGNLVEILNKMQKKVKYLNSREDLINFLAYYYGELNMIHPFREGNGRTLRTYFLLLVKKITNGEFELDYSLWSDEDKDLLIKATIINSVNGDIEGIESCFEKVLVSQDKKRSRR